MHFSPFVDTPGSLVRMKFGCHKPTGGPFKLSLITITKGAVSLKVRSILHVLFVIDGLSESLNRWFAIGVLTVTANQYSPHH